MKRLGAVVVAIAAGCTSPAGGGHDPVGPDAGGGGDRIAADARPGDPQQGDLAGEDGDNITPACATWRFGFRSWNQPAPGWSDRPYYVRLPAGYECDVPAAVVVTLHGGGGTKEGALRLTCPQATILPWPDWEAPGCIGPLADREGFVVVSPSGAKNPSDGERTFNAGGGAGGYACISAYACGNNIDDVGYIRDVLDDVMTMVNIDTARVFATGISNGGAMSQRLACQLAGRISAVASVGGQAQLAVSDPSACAPGRAVPVMIIHGTDDPGWPYEDPPGSGLPGNMPWGADTRLVASVQQTEEFWTDINGCTARDGGTALPDLDTTDSSTVIRYEDTGCSDGADVVLLRVAGGGHTWPGGWQYRGAAKIGPTNRDISANELIWAFFASHPRP